MEFPISLKSRRFGFFRTSKASTFMMSTIEGNFSAILNVLLPASLDQEETLILIGNSNTSEHLTLVHQKIAGSNLAKIILIFFLPLNLPASCQYPQNSDGFTVRCHNIPLYL